MPPLSSLRRHALPLALALTSFLCAALGQPLTGLLRYQRDAILAGQWWRLLTGNLVHLGWPHLWLNLVGLLLVWLLFQRALPQRVWLTVTAVSSLAVGLGLLIFDPNLAWYVGLSGTLHGLFAAGLVASLAAGQRAEWLLLVLFIAKLSWEQLVGPTPGTSALAGGNVIVDAHLYGTVGGAFTVVVWRYVMRRG
jgi:rhomboid family GlyGly-CTERM serine protease